MPGNYDLRYVRRDLHWSILAAARSAVFLVLPTPPF